MKKIPFLTIMLLLVSCGKKVHEKKSPQSPRKVVATRESQNPIRLAPVLNKSGCSTDSFSDEQRNIDLSLFIRGNLLEEKRLFTGLLDGLSVRDIGGQIISDTRKGQSVVYNYVSTDDVITAHVKEHSAPTNVVVCPDAGKYERGTVESAALNATFFISKTSRKISELLPEVKLAPITVEIAPLIKKALSVIVNGEVVWEYEAFETDNAYYNPASGSITFLPHSEEFRKTGMNISFWEIPMVASHEYGHHIFQSIHPSEEKLALKNCLGHFGLQNETAGDEARERSVSHEDVLSALNEGFADLVSHYTLSNRERGLKGVDCLEISRDVRSKVFADGTPKIFSATALSDFFSTKQVKAPLSCKAPHYQDVHIIGAIFAHTADRFLSLSTETKDQRLKIVLKWLQELKSREGALKSQSPENYLREAFQLLVDVTVNNTDGKLDAAECEILPELYPGIDGHIKGCTLI